MPTSFPFSHIFLGQGSSLCEREITSSEPLDQYLQKYPTLSWIDFHSAYNDIHRAMAMGL